MNNRYGWPDRTIDTVIYALLGVLAAAALYPMVYIALASVSDANELISHSGLLLHSFGFHLDAYRSVFSNRNIMTGYGNTLFILVFGVAVNIVLTTVAAYVLSRKNVYWNRYFLFFIVLTMFFNGGLIPYYLTVKSVGLLDSLWALIIPASVNTFNLIIMRTSFQAIPDSMEESAKMDGAGHFTILLRIIVPLSLPVLAVMILYYAVEKWNAWFYASLFLRDRSLFPLQLILREILIANTTGSMKTGGGMDDSIQIIETIKYATIIVATLPILLVYPFLQKYFVKGVMVGALKG
ncbi:carbohydrate ABC transporter permease [Paenibacillus cymbidii]|uniref:carbohydrate ABC transporter permease n=1 Tax=Paenibacillus cymbidii TaxID=1639034 RepID=UPI001081CEF9|nr:carbohydrate ABC transporter permease [Paenibacillus cymbidii]